MFGHGHLNALLRAALPELEANLRLRALRSEDDLVAFVQLRLALDAAAVQKRAVRAAGIAQHVLAVDLADLRMPAGNVQVGIRIEPQIARGVAADDDDGFVEALHVSRARARQNSQLEWHSKLP